jgi:hypothetical protein
VAVQAFLPHVPAVDLGTPVPRNFQAVPVRVRSPAEQNTIASFCRETDELHQPADSRLLYVYSRVITAGAARIGDRRSKCREHAQLGRSGINKRGETRMILATAIRQHEPEKVFDDILGSRALSGNFHSF